MKWLLSRLWSVIREYDDNLLCRWLQAHVYYADTNNENYECRWYCEFCGEELRDYIKKPPFFSTMKGGDV